MVMQTQRHPKSTVRAEIWVLYRLVLITLFHMQQQNLPELDGFDMLCLAFLLILTFVHSPEGISSYFKRIEDSEYAARKQWMDLALVCHRWYCQPGISQQAVCVDRVVTAGFVYATIMD